MGLHHDESWRSHQPAYPWQGGVQATGMRPSVIGKYDGSARQLPTVLMREIGVDIRSPLARLIHLRMLQLGIDSQALGFRLGYQNPAKATGRVYALCDGHLANRKSKAALLRLPDALELPSHVVAQAILATVRQERRRIEDNRAAREAEEAAWRTNFSPHAIIEVEHTVLSQITVVGLTGGIEEWLIVRLDHSQPPITFVQQVLAALPEKMQHDPDGRPHVPFFGEALGFIINYAPDKALRCSLTGEPLQVLPKAYGVEEIGLQIGNRRVSAKTAACLFNCD
jgi:hypothetical protein